MPAGRRWPGSLRSLIIAGFLLALAPPLAALAWAAWTLNALVAASGGFEANHLSVLCVAMSAAVVETRSGPRRERS